MRLQEAAPLVQMPSIGWTPLGSPVLAGGMWQSTDRPTFARATFQRWESEYLHPLSDLARELLPSGEVLWFRWVAAKFVTSQTPTSHPSLCIRSCSQSACGRTFRQCLIAVIVRGADVLLVAYAGSEADVHFVPGV